MRITGGIPVGGNLGAGAVAGGLSFPIDTDDFNPNDEKEFKQRFQAPGSWREQIKQYQRQNPLQRQMPSAGIGNVSGMLLAQGMPPGGDASGLGGMMQMGPQFGPKPLNLNIDAANDRLEGVGGSANIQLDQNQLLQLGASFNPAFTDEMGMQNPQGYQVYGRYTTPSVGIDVNYRNTRGNRSAVGGFPGEVQAGFKGRF
jgi:hypothetical protein